jgi:hypothetical protein
MVACIRCSFVPRSGQVARTNSLLRSGRCDSRRATCEASTASKTTNAPNHHSCDMHPPCCVALVRSRSVAVETGRAATGATRTHLLRSWRRSTRTVKASFSRRLCLKTSRAKRSCRLRLTVRSARATTATTRRAVRTCPRRLGCSGVRRGSRRASSMAHPDMTVARATTTQKKRRNLRSAGASETHSPTGEGCPA